MKGNREQRTSSRATSVNLQIYVLKVTKSLLISLEIGWPGGYLVCLSKVHDLTPKWGIEEVNLQYN